MTTQDRLAALIAAEQQADRLFAAIETNRLIRPGRTETEIDQDIYTLAEQSFGVTQHWHKRIVRAGPNTVRVFAETPPVHEIAENDTVFLDLGPVFDAWGGRCRSHVRHGQRSAENATVPGPGKSI